MYFTALMIWPLLLTSTDLVPLLQLFHSSHLSICFINIYQPLYFLKCHAYSHLRACAFITLPKIFFLYIFAQPNSIFSRSLIKCYLLKRPSLTTLFISQLVPTLPLFFLLLYSIASPMSLKSLVERAQLLTVMQLRDLCPSVNFLSLNIYRFIYLNFYSGRAYIQYSTQTLNIYRYTQLGVTQVTM